MKKRIIGNWKMNGTQGSLGELEAMRDGVQELSVIAAICPPSTLVASAAATCNCSALAIGGQDCHFNSSGAHTGDVSAAMLVDAGASMVILGHSERRADHDEPDALIADKTKAALDAGLIPIVCVGETETQRDAGQETTVVGTQLHGAELTSDADADACAVVAYEPVWAIGTGRTPTLEQIGEMHSFIRGELVKIYGEQNAQRIPILYGGSVKPGNADEIFAVPDVDGALIGGASLKAPDFLGIARAGDAAS